jgi:hypothetical protein
MNSFKKVSLSALTCLALPFAAGTAQAAVINFAAAGATGHGSAFASAGNAETLTFTAGGYDVVISGGVMLGPNINFLPASSGLAYGTADSIYTGAQTGYLDTLTIKFYNQGTSTLANISNFFVDVFNGNTVPVDYTLSDNLGATSTFNIANNTSSGQQTFGIAAAGNTITVAAGAAVGGCCKWDFFINNIGFNEALPPGSTKDVPEPSTLALLGLSLLGVGMIRRRARA